MFATSPYTDTVMSPELVVDLPAEHDETQLWVVGPVLAVVFIICIVSAILLYKKWVFFLLCAMFLGNIQAPECKCETVQPQMIEGSCQASLKLRQTGICISLLCIWKKKKKTPVL